MKMLLLIRHAEAGWGDFGQADVERLLTERGVQQAHAIVRNINDEALIPDVIFSSTAKRTAMTAQILAAGISFPVEQVIWRNELYLAEAELLFSVAQQADDHIQSLAIIAHNPGLSELADRLLSKPIHGMSPATVVAITWPVEHWSDISEGRGTLSAHLHP